MRATYNRGVHWFAVFVVCWTVLLFIAGALVTSNDAALSVPDWPKSHGSWIPPLDTLRAGALFEFSHRVIAGSLGMFMLILAIVLWVKDRRPALRWFAVIAVGGVAVQAVLGGQVVIQMLHYWLPVIHACFAEIVFAAVVAMALFTSKWWMSDRPQIEDCGPPSIHGIVTLNAVVIFLQVILGAGFRHKEIPIWPHVTGAGMVLGMITWTTVALRKRFGDARELVKVRIMLHVVLGIQLLLGFGAWWSRITTAEAPQPMPVMVTFTVIHTVVGALLFALSVAVVLVCYRVVARKREVLAAAQREATIS